MKIELLQTLGAFSLPLAQCARSVAVDSRLAQPGAVFFALPGEKTDGHQFLHDVVEKGVSGAVIKRDFHGEIPKNFPVMRVQDPLHTLQTFAQLSVRDNGAQICAVTGSVGKTTTKDFLSCIASREKRVVATTKSYNSQIGLSLSLLNEMKGGEDWIIAEMGMSHPGEIFALAKIAPPNVAVVTNVSLVHAENFPSLEAIASAKAELFARPETSQCLFNADTNHPEVLLKAASGRGKSFSMNSSTAFWYMHVGDNKLFLRENCVEKELPKPEFPAPHVYENLLAAIAAARAMGVSWKGIEEALPLLHLPSLHLEHVRCRGLHFINDSCNACVPSMIAALDTLKRTPGTRKIAVLGAMKELGSFSIECHEKVGKKAYEVADALYFLGQEWCGVVEKWECKEKKCIVASSLDELIAHLEKDLDDGDSVLLKGSRWANQLWKVVEHFQGGKD